MIRNKSFWTRFKGHWNTVYTHKKWVYHYGKLMGIRWQAAIHDLSKYNPIEFLEGVKYWTGSCSPIDVCKKANGWSRAWMHHKGRNPHHYEYWVDNLDRGGIALDMPRKYKLELLCDYLAAGRAYMGSMFSYTDELLWWENKRSGGIKMHENVERFLTDVFIHMSVCEPANNDDHFYDAQLDQELKNYVAGRIKEEGF